MKILFLILLLASFVLTTCESPTSPNRDQEKQEIRDNNGLRN